MIETAVSNHGVVAAPGRAAAETGRLVLIEGGDAYEALVAMAATSAVVTPRSCGLGADAVWTVREPSGAMRALDACGRAGAGAARYGRLGFDAVPERGPHAALTVPGAVDGWRLALEIAASLGGRLPLPVLFGDAIRHARDGFAVAATTLACGDDAVAAPGFADTFRNGDKPYAAGETLRQPRLADALEYLSRAGLKDFYRGDVARELTDDLERIGAPLGREDFRRHEARLTKPLSLRIKGGTLHGSPPPAQGLAALALAGILERLAPGTDQDAAFVHAVVEAAKRAMLASAPFAADPGRFDGEPDAILSAKALDLAAGAVDAARAGAFAGVGFDRAALAVDRAVSLGSPFGSGCVSSRTGVLLSNAGAGFSLDPDAANALAPGRRPPHALNAGLAAMADGRVVLVGGSRPETSAALLVRHLGLDRPVEAALASPGFRLAAGSVRDGASLALDAGFDGEIADRLERLGHRVVALQDDPGAARDAAGLIVRSAAGRIEGACAPGSEGTALGL